MAQRTYIPTLIKLTSGLCRTIAFADPVIRRLFPTNVALIAALEAANLACQTLNQEAQAVRQFGD